MPGAITAIWTRSLWVLVLSEQVRTGSHHFQVEPSCYGLAENAGVTRNIFNVYRGQFEVLVIFSTLNVTGAKTRD